MVFTRSQYRKLGKVLVSWERTKKSRGKKMVNETSDKDRLDAMEAQLASVTSTLAELAKFIKQEKKVNSTKKPKEAPESGDESGETDTEGDTDDDSDTSQQGGKDSLRNLKVDFKVEIPMYDGSVNVEKLDDWIERLDTYFTLYGYSSKEKIIFATLKLSVHALSWWKSYRKRNKGEAVSWKKFKELLRKQFYPVGFLEERWYKWYNLRQKFNQSVQDYTTEFQNQALVLDIALEEYPVYMKYVAGLSEYIRKELKLFTVESISEASAKAIAIEGKCNETKGDENQSGSKSRGFYAKKEEHKQNMSESDGKECLVCNHCGENGHVMDKCWVKTEGGAKESSLSHRRSNRSTRDDRTECKAQPYGRK